MLVGKKLRGGSNSESVAAEKAYNIRNKERVLYHQLFGKLVSDKETIWGQPPFFIILKWLFHILSYINYYFFKLASTVLIHKFFNPMCFRHTK